MFELPPGAERVLTNSFNANQGYVLDGRHIGFQGHIEMTRPLVETWLATGGDELPCATTASTQTAADIRSALDARLAELNAVASAVYTRWSRGLQR